MRILHVMAGKGNGGAELYSTDVMLSLHQAGIDQCVVMRPDAPRTAELMGAGLRVDTNVLQIPFRPLQRLRMRQLIADEKPDIIQCWMRRAVSLVPADAKTKAEIIGWFGDYEELKYFAHCTKFVGVTRDLVRHMVENGVPSDDAAYIPTFPTVDDGAAIDRATLATPADAPVLLTLSRLHPVKGLDTMLQALADLPGYYLWVAGDGPSLAALQTQAAGLGVASRVRFLGWRTDRGALLRAADICVLPSRYEPFGTVILDAWSTRTAFVACNSDGPGAYVHHEQDGMLVPINDATALANAIRNVMNDPVLRQNLIRQGFANYQTQFTRGAVTAKYIAYYNSLLNR
ncbi:MAG: glycosyltransferase [Acidocella sp. 20-63-7]|nr:MAG: glycosyltransferase [Acidocella sp. 20-63-7]